jgi:hypothetical protein
MTSAEGSYWSVHVVPLQPALALRETAQVSALGPDLFITYESNFSYSNFLLLAHAINKYIYTYIS